MTTVRYFLPEDGDSEFNPNVFLAPKPKQPGAPPTLAEIKQAFPLPGQYHFRFKSPLVPGGDREKHSVAVWMDCVDDRQLIPIWKNAIIAKVTRLSDEEDDDEDEEEEEHFVPARQQQQQATPPIRHAPDLDIFGTTTSAPRSAPSSMPNSASNSMHNFLDSHHPSPASSGASSSLLDMQATPTTAMHNNNHHNAAANDFLGMMSHTPQHQPPSYSGYPPQGGTPARPPTTQGTPATLPRPSGSNAFDSFTTANVPDQGPFGGLEWK